jgi:hypothetical protein
MVNNSTNINKSNNQPRLTLNHWTQKKTMTYGIGNPGPGLGQAHKCGRVKQVNGILTSSWLIIARHPEDLFFLWFIYQNVSNS